MTTRLRPEPAAANDVADRRTRTALWLAAGGAVVCLAATINDWPVDDVGSLPRPPVRVGLDPNTAAWFELAQLPGLGERTARSIVAYRERRETGPKGRRAVYLTPGDLNLVPGIGRRTVQRIRPFLLFGISDSEG